LRENPEILLFDRFIKIKREEKNVTEINENIDFEKLFKKLRKY
jgi:hypothetical protein